VILNAILGFLAVLSLALLLWQWLNARRFPLHARSATHSFPPAATLLKPLKGCEPATEDCLRSWFAQEYTGRVQILFGVASEEDPVCAVVRQLQQVFPEADAQLVICGPQTGTNAKVSKLAIMEQLAKHELLIISDADVRVPSDFLSNAVEPLRKGITGVCAGSAHQKAVTVPVAVEASSAREVSRDRSSAVRSAAAGSPLSDSNRKSTPSSEVGLVNCFYRMANPTTVAMQWEAVAINADFWSQVLQSETLKPLDFALGAVMIVRRDHLAEIGGFSALMNCLADDYQLGNRIARAGYRIMLSSIVVECWSAPMNWKAVWKHQLRWARTIRVCQPAPYFFSILSNPTLWPLVWLAVAPGIATSVVCFVSLATRIAAGLDLQSRLTLSRKHFGYWWLIPLKDLLQAAIWLLAFLGNTVEWRGERMRLRRDGTLVKTHSQRK